jgi:hypothetical protein
MNKAFMHLTMFMLLAAATGLHAAVYYITVAGLGGEPDYEQRFTASANDLDHIFHTEVGAYVTTLTGSRSTRSRLTEAINQVAHQAKPGDEFILTLIGHGTYDGTVYKFNLVGPDISAYELAALCDRVPSRRQLIVNASSASGASVAALERPGRAVIAATKAGTEKNATVFARYWVEALQDPTADLDKSDSISALEALRYADGKTVAFYESQKRLATEHAVFEDVGHGDPVRVATAEGREGALLSSMIVVRIGTAQAARSDPARLTLFSQKEELEQKIDLLKYQKAAMEPGEYKQQLVQLLIALAKVQEQLDK